MMLHADRNGNYDRMGRLSEGYRIIYSYEESSGKPAIVLILRKQRNEG